MTDTTFKPVTLTLKGVAEKGLAALKAGQLQAQHVTLVASEDRRAASYRDEVNGSPCVIGASLPDDVATAIDGGAVLTQGGNPAYAISALLERGAVILVGADGVPLDSHSPEAEELSQMQSAHDNWFLSVQRGDLPEAIRSSARLLNLLEQHAHA